MITVLGKLPQHILVANFVRTWHLYKEARLPEMGFQQLPLCLMQTSDVLLRAVYFEFVYQLRKKVCMDEKLI